MPIIPKSEFARRRRAYAKVTGDGVSILQASPLVERNSDVEYPYRQDSNFLYLTGFPEDGSVAVIRPGKKPFYVLFVKPKNRREEVWTGLRFGERAAKKQSGADAVYSIADLAKRLPKLIGRVKKVYYEGGHSYGTSNVIRKCIRGMKKQSPAKTIASLRVKKSSAEVKMQEYAIEITRLSHAEAARTIRPGKFEYEIKALIEYEFARHNAEPGYGTIVGAGENALILHYITCQDKIKKGDLVLIDAGAEVEGYTADVTRTYPASGKFTAAQRKVYEIVLAANKKVIHAIRPGAKLVDLQKLARTIIVEGLVREGIVKTTVKKLEKQESDPKKKGFFNHGVSHSLGIDVHDPGLRISKKKCRDLEPDMVLTVEPGIYIMPQAKVPKQFHNIGIRIEDDVLVTKSGCRVLTRSIPKEVKAIEKMMRRA